MAKRKPQIEAAHNIFISWSGERSKAAAQALREWLPIILQAAKPWMSDSDIEKGSVGLDEVARALGMKVGIICLTPENLSAEWILFEAGALAKEFDDKTRVCTYLLGGLRKQDVRRPLGMFQATTADKDETHKLVRTINRHLDAEPVSESGLDELFEMMWPKLEAKLATLPKPSGAAAPKRPVEEMVAEVLELTRAMTPQILGLVRDDLERRAKEWQSTRSAMVKLSDLLGDRAELDPGERARLIAKIKLMKKSSR